MEPGLTTPDPGDSSTDNNQQQEACGYMFVTELDLTWRPQFNGKYSSMEVNFGGLSRSDGLNQRDVLATWAECE